MKKDSDKAKGLDRIWAPWRMQYISCIDGEKEEGCIFCVKPSVSEDEKNFIVYRGEKCFVILNIFPYNNGHLMVVPYMHTATLSELDSETRLEMMNLASVVVEAMKNTMRPDGFNIGMNLGRTAGAGIDAHIHLHVVPRWNGDTNFMPVVGGTKVISEALEATYDKIKTAMMELVGK